MNICVWDEVKRIDMNKDRTGKQPPCGLGHVCGGLNWVADPGRMGDTEGALAVLGSEGVSEYPGSFENWLLSPLLILALLPPCLIPYPALFQECPGIIQF